METFRFAPAYELPTFPFEPPPELKGSSQGRYPVVIVGAGPAGLTLACDLAQRGVKAVLLDEDDTVGVKGASSRGICYAQKSLEAFDRLGIADRIVGKGVTWSFGRTFTNEAEIYNFNLKATSVSKQPPFVNLQQFYLEWFIVDRIMEIGNTDVRWKSKVVNVEPHDDHVVVQVTTPSGSYSLEAEYLIDATGANSPIRTQLKVETNSSRSTDRWCIADVKFKKPLPTERWTWVNARFNEGRGVWQHLMADGVWRMDYQMPEDADTEYISRPDVAGARLRKQLGEGVEFEFVWIGPYGYRDHLLNKFRLGRVFFIGDSAHVVSPFGARGGNSGIQDAFNIGWKLALVCQGKAPASLLDSYDAERRPAAIENLTVTSRTSRFLAPRSPAEHIIRRAAVELACRYEFARPLVNTGRMSVANAYPESAWLPEGAKSLQNMPLQWSTGEATSVMELLEDGTCFVALCFGMDEQGMSTMRRALAGWPVTFVHVGGHAEVRSLRDEGGVLASQLNASAHSVCILRPDAYIAATIDAPTAQAVESAMQRALGKVLAETGDIR